MNKIVREHYPVERLPQDLRVGFLAGKTVTITLQEEKSDHSALTSAEWIKKLKASRNLTSACNDDPVERIRRLRDEWED